MAVGNGKAMNLGRCGHGQSLDSCDVSLGGGVFVAVAVAAAAAAADDVTAAVLVQHEDAAKLRVHQLAAVRFLPLQRKSKNMDFESISMET